MSSKKYNYGRCAYKDICGRSKYNENCNKPICYTNKNNGDSRVPLLTELVEPCVYSVQQIEKLKKETATAKGLFNNIESYSNSTFDCKSAITGEAEECKHPFCFKEK